MVSKTVCFVRLYTDLQNCQNIFAVGARFYRFRSDVYIFPNIREEKIVKSLSAAMERCENYSSNPVSIKAQNEQMFLKEKLAAIYKEYWG